MTVRDPLELQIREIVQNSPMPRSAEEVYLDLPRRRATKQRVVEALYKLADSGEVEAHHMGREHHFGRPKAMGPAPGQDLHDAYFAAETALRLAKDDIDRLRVVTAMLFADDEKFAQFKMFMG